MQNIDERDAIGGWRTAEAVLQRTTAQRVEHLAHVDIGDRRDAERDSTSGPVGATPTSPTRSFSTPGDALVALGILDVALVEYRTALAIAQRLSANDPTRPTPWACRQLADKVTTCCNRT